MDKKRRLLDALAPLEMPFENKQEFVNLLLDRNNSNGGGGGYNLGDEMELTIPYGVDNTLITIKYKFGDTWVDYIFSDKNTNGLRLGDDFKILFDVEEGFYAILTYKGESPTNVAPPEMIYPWREYVWSIVG